MHACSYRLFSLLFPFLVLLVEQPLENTWWASQLFLIKGLHQLKGIIYVVLLQLLQRDFTCGSEFSFTIYSKCNVADIELLCGKSIYYFDIYCRYFSWQNCQKHHNNISACSNTELLELMQIYSKQPGLWLNLSHDTWLFSFVHWLWVSMDVCVLILSFFFSYLRWQVNFLPETTCNRLQIISCSKCVQVLFS